MRRRRRAAEKPCCLAQAVNRDDPGERIMTLSTIGDRSMKITHVAAVALLLAGTAYAQQSQHEATPPVPPGARHVPEHIVPVPDTVSPQMQAIIAQPYNPTWNVVPKTPAEWKAIVDKAAGAVVATLPEIRAALGVTVQPTTIAGVKSFIVTPKVDSAPQPRPCPGARAWRRLRAQPRRSGDQGGDRAGRIRRLQGDLGRLPHAAGLIRIPPRWTTRWRCIARC